MKETIANRIRKLVQKGYNARSAFYESMDEPNEQELGLPAPENCLKKLEEKIGTKLPPSYRSFLSQFDGWKMIDAAVDLYSCRKLLEIMDDENTKMWQQTAIDEGDEFIETSIIIGGSDFSASKYLLDTSSKNESGEFTVIEYEGGIEKKYENFLHFLQDSLVEFKQFSDEINSGFKFE
jgi:cell wall assembly regulator SMI1